MTGETQEFDTPEEAKVAKQTRKVKDRRGRELAEFRELLKSKAFRDLLWRWMASAGVYRQSFVGDSERTFFREGERNIGNLMLTDILDADPEAYLRMIRENRPQSKGA